MKNLLLLGSAAALLMFSSPAGAQSITLTQANFPASASGVERYMPVTRVPSSFALPQPGANQAWDYSSLVADSAVAEQHYQVPGAASGPTFGAATRRYAENTFIGISYYVTGASNFPYNRENYEALTPSGLQRLGFTLAADQWQLASPNTTAAYTWEVPAQQVAYEGPAYQVQFPLTASSASAMTYRTVTQLRVTEPGSGLNAAPVRLVHRVAQTDTVVGYGTMRLPTAMGPSAAFPVLMQRTVMQETDSLYLGSQPAPAQLLETLNMQQGRQYNTFRTAFFRENSAQPALQLFYSNAGFQTLRPWFSIWYSGEANLGTVTSTRAGQLPAGALQAYPNPVTTGRFTLTLAGDRQPVQLIVRDLVGRQVASAATVSGEPTAVLSGLQPGLYSVEATTRDGQRGTVRVQVQ
ncbi:T9SS type A sorting domain-containing protein [Hymenobacter negativus]|uniref:T9SS type A sorting domain-containing protein n=1 Tax=Hymenobacter negativus TaxID=2795026 RepID=A0ABS3QH80_9BACT|nr:T9SS type A sorting domain-containing protein [Hymenobacter negativus]MBO2010343.1 T9SS type A sorting domain-containing protein [Hymenobacter negativus]